MNYQSQEEHDYYEGARGEAEAEYQQDCAYQEYLDSLFTSGQKDLFALTRCIDMLHSTAFVDSNMTAIEYLFRLKQEIENPPKVDSADINLPF